MDKWSFKNCLDIIQAVSLIVGIFFVGFQIRNQTATLQASQKINSANFVLKISDEIDKAKYEKTNRAIDEHDTRYKLLHNGFTARQIEDYIGVLDTLGNLVKDNLITPDMAYDELGYELEKAWCNQDIHNYIIKLRKDDNNEIGANAYYTGLEKLALYCMKKDNLKACPDMDK